MTFLNPIVLFGLLAASIPVLLHIFNLRKLKTIEFSTLSFLKELQKTKIRRLKIRQILLLVLRTLLIVLLVTAFSRPTLKGTLAEGVGPRSKTTAVFLIDDSYSMTGADDQGELLKQAKQSAAQALNLLRNGDEVFLVKLSEATGEPTENQKIPMRSFASLRSAIAEIRPSYIHRNMEPAFLTISQLLGSSLNFNKEVYLFSDFQSGILKSATKRRDVRFFTPETRFFVIPVGNRRLQNVSVEAVSIPNSIFEPGMPFSVVAKITNGGENEIVNTIVSIFAGGTRVAQKGATIAGMSSADVSLSVVPKSSGFLEGMVSLENDDLEFDNTRYFVVPIPTELRVLLVGPRADLRYLRTALETRGASDTSLLRITETVAERLSSNQISAADVIVLSNVREFSPTQVDRLRMFVSQGGGMMFFPGPSTTQQSFNSILATSLRLPSLVAVEGLSQVQSQSFLEFDQTDLRHPIFTGMFEEEIGSQDRNERGRTVKRIESAKVKAFARYLANAQSLPVITLSNGAPFLLDQRVGEGRVLLFSVAANLEWSDFPLKGLFVPLMHRTLSYLARDQSQRASLLVGNDVVVKNIRSPASAFTVQDPRKNEFSVQATIRGAERTIRLPETSLPGIYIVKSGNEVIRKFAVNITPEESQTEKDEKALAALLEWAGIEPSSVHVAQNAKELPRVVTESRYGLELWKHFLIAALIVAIAEMLVAKDSRKELAELNPQTAS